jgi:hypothetical protein
MEFVMQSIYEQINQIADQIESIEFDGVNNVSIPDTVQIINNDIVYNGVKYNNFEDCMIANVAVAEDYYAMMQEYYNNIV